MYKHAKSFSETKMQQDAVRFSIEQKAHQLLKSRQERIDELKFTDKYPLASIESDLKDVAIRESQFKDRETPEQKRINELSKIFEMLLPELAELYNWLGENVYIITASRFDDIKNGVDLVAEITENETLTHLGLAIDVTLSGYNLDKKVSSIASRIKDGHLTSVKYFESDNSGFHDALKDIVKVVVATDRKTLDDLAETKLILDNLEQRRKKPLSEADASNISKQIKEIKEKLRIHPLQVFILEQIRIQLERYAQYAAAVNQHEIAKKYREVLPIIEKIYSDKVNDKEFMNSVDLDRTKDSHMSGDVINSLDKILGPDSREDWENY